MSDFPISTAVRTFLNSRGRVQSQGTVHMGHPETGFYPMNGYTIAQTVSMKIEGAHLAANKGTRQGATSILSAY